MISTPTPLDDLKECNEYPWKTEDDKKKDEKKDEYDEESDDD
jgi:hypothetical protein